MEYNKFIRQFRTRILANTKNENERMNYLEQYTICEANIIDSGYGHVEAEKGYPAGMKELQVRYGDIECIAHAYVKKVLDWSDMKAYNPKAPDDFSIFLVDCGMQCTILEYQENI
ncbi:uncharacterized protein LOC144351989 [Saccoglossus kowalevskii]